MKKTIALILAVVSLVSVISILALSASAATPNAKVSEALKVTIQNVETGEYLNFDYGNLKNGTPVRVWPWDGSVEQLWNITKVSTTTYRITTNKSPQYCLDVYRGSCKLKAGQKCDIWKTGDDAVAQNVTFYLCDDGSYIIRMENNSDLAIAATASKDRVKLVKFDPSDRSQRWKVKDSNGNGININNVDITNGSTDWNALVGSTVASIKKGSSYTKWYNSSNNVSAKGGYTGQCTWYALGRFYEVTGINLGKAPDAKKWLSANKNNAKVSVLYGADKITENAIAVDTNGKYGHVLFIEHIEYDADGNPQYVYFTECNWDANGTYNANKDCVLKKMVYSQFIIKRGPDGYIVAK